MVPIRRFLALLVVLALSGCTTAKSLYKNNEALVVDIAGSISAPACGAAVSGLKAGEAIPACVGLNACAQAVCQSPAGHP